MLRLIKIPSVNEWIPCSFLLPNSATVQVLLGEGINPDISMQVLF